MLQSIWIKNFALIDELKLDFKTGYTVLSGETGSGKSIFLGALNLILGERADYALIGPGAAKAVVEVEFLINENLKAWFDSEELDFAPNTIIRREISESGRSRTFINDVPVSLIQLRDLSSQLVAIHSQYDTLTLKNKSYHMDLVDVLGGFMSIRAEIQKEFNEWVKVKQEIEELQERIQKARADQDYLSFQIEELRSLNLDQIVYAEIEDELAQLEHVDEIQQTVSSFLQVMDAEPSILGSLNSIRMNFERLSSINSELKDYAERIASLNVETKELTGDLHAYLDRVEQNPERLIELTNKLDGYNRALTKHASKSQGDLLGLYKTWQLQLIEADSGDENLTLLKEKESSLLKTLKAKAQSLHSYREQCVPIIESSMLEILRELKLPDMKVRFLVRGKEKLTATGLTDVAFEIQPNPGMGWQPVEKAASGGELSRLMLAIQYLVSQKTAMPTVLFDEIDTGVSGEVAQKIGLLLRKMGANFQLIAISHLPQVVGKAQQHIKVEKSSSGDRTVSTLTYLNEEERVEEVARLMSGATINEAAKQSAKNLMSEE